MTLLADQLARNGLMTTFHAAEFLGCSPTYIRKLKSKGELHPHVEHGFPLLYRRDELEAYRDKHPYLGTRRIA